jgi:hypothetical protein
MIGQFLGRVVSKSDNRVTHREKGTYPGLLEAQDVFAPVVAESGETVFVLTKPSKAYSKDW